MESKYDGRRPEPPYVTDSEKALEDCEEAQKMLMDTYEEVFDERDKLRADYEALEAKLAVATEREKALEADKKLLEDDIKLLELYLKTARNDREILRIKVRCFEAKLARLVDEIENYLAVTGDFVTGACNKQTALEAERMLDEELKAAIEAVKVKP